MTKANVLDLIHRHLMGEATQREANKLAYLILKYPVWHELYRTERRRFNGKM
jgi:hypothetical protein